MSVFSFMTICIVGTVVIGAAGLIIDNRLDKEEGIGYDHHGNEIAHNWTGGLVLLWWTLCGIGPRFLIDFGNDSNHRQKRGFVKASFFKP